MTAKNILVFTSIYPIKGTESGHTPIVKYFCEDWVRQGHNVYVVSSTSKFPLLYYLIPNFLKKFLESKIGFNLPNVFSRKKILNTENGVRVLQLPIFKIYPGQHISEKAFKRNIKEIESSFILNFKPDLCIGHWTDPQILYLSYFKRKYKSNTTLTLHNVPNDKEIYLLKKYLDDIDSFGFRSEKLIKPTLQLINLNRSRCFLCYSGVKDYFNLEKNLINNKFLNQNKIDICFIGNLIERKFPDIILKALNEIDNIEFEVHFIGEGYMLNFLKNYKTKQNINVQFHGKLERSKVYEILSKCELLVMLSKNETFGLVYLEAMLNRTIPIASFNEGFDGIIKDGYNGFLGNSGSVDDLVKIINKYMKLSSKEKVKLQDNAFITAINMTDDKMALQYLNNITNANNKK